MAFIGLELERRSAGFNTVTGFRLKEKRISLGCPSSQPPSTGIKRSGGRLHGQRGKRRVRTVSSPCWTCLHSGVMGTCSRLVPRSWLARWCPRIWGRTQSFRWTEARGSPPWLRSGVCPSTQVPLNSRLVSRRLWVRVWPRAASNSGLTEPVNSPCSRECSPCVLGAGSEVPPSGGELSRIPVGVLSSSVALRLTRRFELNQGRGSILTE